MATILVVDDNPTSRQLLAALLNQWGHHSVPANDGAEALSLLQTVGAHLIICDILMPTIDGFEFVRQLRENRSIPGAPVIFCSATFLEREALALAESCGVTQVLTKPIDANDLHRVVDQALAQQTEPRPLNNTGQFNRAHLRLVTDKLIEKDSRLEFATNRLSALTELNLQLASERDPETLLDRLCYGARGLIGSRCAVLGVPDLHTGRWVRFGTWGIPGEGHEAPDIPVISSGILGEVLREVKTVRITVSGGDVTTLGLSSRFPSVQYALIAPIASLKHCYGWVLLGDKVGGGEFTDEDAHLLSIHAAQAGRIYENGILYTQANRHAMQQTLVAQFGQHAFASRNLNELLAEALDILRQGLEIKYCEILRLNLEGDILPPDEDREPGVTSAGGKTTDAGTSSQTRFVLDAVEPLIVDDYHAETRFVPPNFITSEVIRSGAHVVLKTPSGPIGVLSVYAPDPHQFTSESVSFQRAIAYVVETVFTRAAAEEHVKFLAQFNPVTGLPNRSRLIERLEQTLMQARRGGWLVGVIFLDLDRFKAINDTYGHDAGDRLLRIAATRLVECVQAGDTVAHTGADEFVIVLARLWSTDAAIPVAAQVIKSLSEPFELSPTAEAKHALAYVTASAGISLYPGDGTKPNELLTNADIAMSRAKDSGRCKYEFYLPHMNERATTRSRLETELRSALKQEQFLLHFQPKISVRSRDICGFEALLRWQHPSSGLMPPGDFISILEDTGLIEAVGKWVLKTTCSQIRHWQDQGLILRPVSVNLSSRQFREPDLARIVADIICAAGIDPRMLEFELTESILMEDTQQTARTLGNLKALGVGISVDDFGTGYSSLAYLRRFALDTLKIDREFVRDCVSDPNDAAIAQAIISLAHSLGLNVVAEGVETQQQLEFLVAAGCDEFQGYYFSRPIPEAECARMLTKGGFLAIRPDLAEWLTETVAVGLETKSLIHERSC